MFDWKDVGIMITGGIMVFLSFVVGTIGIANGVRVLTEPTIAVYVDDRPIYKGTNAMVNIEGVGYLTKVTINKDLGFVTDKIYLSSDVRVEMLEKDR